MSEELIQNDIYDNVFFIENVDSPPPKPPRTFDYEQNKNKLSPTKPPRGSTNTKTSQSDEIDLSYLTFNANMELTHLTKNRAKLPEKRVPARHLIRSQMNPDSSKNVKDAAIEYLKSRRAHSMVEFSRIRRTAVKIKQGNK